MPHDLKRLSRLTALLTRLQTRRVVTAPALAAQFGVSVRTVYRDMRALEAAGIPIYTEEGKGYSLLEGYRLAPVSFTPEEAHALVTAEHLLSRQQDTALTLALSSAVSKVRAVLADEEREGAALLASRLATSPMQPVPAAADTLMLIQQALVSYQLVRIDYQAMGNDAVTTREVEPFALYFSLEGQWLLIGFCRLRQAFRLFRLGRMIRLETLPVHFAPHTLTLAEFLATRQKNFSHP
ncbi:YafY family protein [Pokkaliibacter sp. MBI-7]|uniref:helix-turn-helix transcriptional regulator n=1 Tax=Pokkaliibacter sp. MBI-7 TaxID=3040600 RepID=UPI00244A06FA|nr:YafY family protein [Pokkaliibacter sp. MBI-7]MDH2433067.1 YafY family protein [Pokkaliibacter sp. MBI-7]